MKKNALTSLLTALIIFNSGAFAQRLEVVKNLPVDDIVAFYNGFDTGGNTSVGFDTNHKFKWSGESPYASGGFGYFTPDGKEIPYIKRDRDLGQTFKVNAVGSVSLKAIMLKLGYGSNVIRENTYGNAVSLQIYEVKGTPVINDNGSPDGTKAFHGYPHNRPEEEIAADRDDYIEGETYKSIAVIRGYTFPELQDFGIEQETVNPNDKRLKGQLLRFSIPEKYGVTLVPNKTYAFMVMLDNECDDCGFTLANNYYGKYEDGHGIRRGGNGVFPPATANPMADFSDRSNKAAMKSAHFPMNFKKRIKIKPSTNGYPDVCTYRDLYFVIEAGVIE